MSRAWRQVANLLIIVILVAGGYWLYQNRNQLLDSWVLRDYTPSNRVAELSSQAQMTEDGQKLFYRADPEINAERATLASNCHIGGDKTIELGCYLSNDKIYLLDIQQPELRNEMVVTATHEMLHAAWDRMSAGEKSEVSTQLQQAYKKLGDKKLQDRIADYNRVEPGEENNELHSILGSEYGNLSPQLEAHYAKYLRNRAAVVAYSDKFEQTFDGLHTEIEQLDVGIKAQRERMNQLLQAGRVSDYNAMVPGVNRDIDSYNSKVDQYNRYATILLGLSPADPAAAAQ